MRHLGRQRLLTLLASLRPGFDLAELPPGDVRPSIIARLPLLEVLNGSPVTTSERKDAERWYIGHVQRLLPDAKDEQRTLFWRRYSHLSQGESAPAGNTPRQASDIIGRKVGRNLNSLIHDAENGIAPSAAASTKTSSTLGSKLLGE